MLNLSRRLVLRLDRLPVVPSFAARLLLVRLVSSRLSSRFSARLAGRVGDWRRLCLRLLWSYGCRVYVIWRLAHRFAYSPSAYRPALSTRMAGRGADDIVACFFLISTVFRSR